MRRIAVANQKGGVGKTTTVVNLAPSFAEKGRRILVIDLDPQANTSSGLGVVLERGQKGIYHALLGLVPLRDIRVRIEPWNLDLIPSSEDLVGLEVEIRERPMWESILRNLLNDLTQEYDLVLIDTPPSLGALTILALVAAHSVLVPVQCEYYALEGLTQLIRTIKAVRRALNPNLEIEGFLLTMYDRRLVLSAQVEEEVRGFFGNKVFRTVIPRSVRVAEAPGYGKPLLAYAPNSNAARAYLDLAEEILSHAAESVGQRT